MPCEGVDSMTNSDGGKTIWSRCYGLPSWMKLPIDRLNTQTNFEEYACSPPETDSGFIHDFDTKMVPEPPVSLKTSRSAPMLSEKPQTLSLSDRQKKSPVILKEVILGETAKLPKPGNLPQQLILPTHQKVFTTHSATPSAENTPTSTPQGSPYIPRKGVRSGGGGHSSSGDESPCGGNTKKWFYTGIFSSDNLKSPTSLPASLNQITEPSSLESIPKSELIRKKKDVGERELMACPIEQVAQAQQQPKTKKEEKRVRKTALTSPGYKKYTVSNFDLNAVSPTSW